MKIGNCSTNASPEINRSIELSPFELSGELGPCRVAIYDNRQERYTKFIDVAPKSKASLAIESLEEHFDYRFKLQKLENGKWGDLTKLQRLLPEEITPDGLKYLFYPCRSSAHLIIVFQAMATNPGYNYIRALSSIQVNKLFIKDDYGTDEATRSSYYLGPDRTLIIAEGIQRLIGDILKQTGIQKSNCSFVGSSKGGFAALYHGFRFGTGNIIAGGPQVRLGTFLNSTWDCSNLPPILRYLAGNTSEDSVAWANQLLPDVMRQAQPPYPRVFIHVGRGDHHYKGHVMPFMKEAADLGIDTVHLDVQDYAKHAELVDHFPQYLHETIQRLVGSVSPMKGQPVDVNETDTKLGELSVGEDCPLCHTRLTSASGSSNCPGCESRSRTRTLQPLLSHLRRTVHSDIFEKPILAFSMSGREAELIGEVFPTSVSVSLYGDYGRQHLTGVDARDLSRYEDSSFSGVYSCLLFDYLLEHEQALDEAFRVIAPGGLFMTHIAPDRLTTNDGPPAKRSTVVGRQDIFQYLRPGEELPSVTVGASWFVNAMRRSGFVTQMVSIRDPLEHQPLLWFLGTKPGPITAARPSNEKPEVDRVQHSRSPGGSKNPQTYNSEITEVFRARMPLRHSLAELRVHDVQILNGSTLDLLESGTEIAAISRDRARFYTSNDAGISWTRRYQSTEFPGPIGQCFTLADGSRIVRIQDPARLLMFDGQDNLIADTTAGQYPWHGSQGIGQSSNGTVMYAEYPPGKHEGAIPIAVWRCKLGQNEWEKVLELMAAEKPPLGDLRHFHVCRPSVANPSLWLLSSGDITSHNRLWLSDDDGDHWREIIVKESPSPRIKQENRQRILRFTSFVTTSDGSFVWGTDDDLGVGTSALVKMSLKDGEANFRIVDWLGPNFTRNIVSLGEDLIMTVSESKNDLRHVELWFVDLLDGIAHSVRVPNLVGKLSPITHSIGGSQLIGGVFFMPASGNLFTASKRGVLRFSLRGLS